MNIKSFFRYVFGISLVIALAGSLTVYQDYRSSYSPSTSSEVNADTFAIGVEYPGVLTKTFVKEGDEVRKGQVLANFKSTILLNQLTEAKITPRDLNYPLADNGEIALTAAKDGTVKDVAYTSGSFVPGNKEIYTLVDSHSKYIVSRHLVATRDLRLLNRNRKIEVKQYEGGTVTLQIRQIDIAISGSNYLVTIESTPINESELAGVEIGSPLPAKVILNDQNLWTVVRDRAQQYYARLASR